MRPVLGAPPPATRVEVRRPRPLAAATLPQQLGALFPQQTGGLKEYVQNNLLQISAALFFVGAVGWCWVIYKEFGSSPADTAYTVASAVDAAAAKTDSFGMSSYMRIDHPLSPSVFASRYEGESAAGIVAREWQLLAPPRFVDRNLVDRNLVDRNLVDRNLASRNATAPRVAEKSPKELSVKPPARLAALEGAPPSVAAFRRPNDAAPSHIRPEIGEQTALVDFETAPFPYHGTVGDSDRQFLNIGEPGQRGHSNFRGHVYWESETFSDDRVLLHIPPGFDPSLPGVIVVFFHGHGANLARDVRDRQQVPAQITAAGANAVLVAPQFAVNAADSSSGKFWEPNGFKRFLDEAAVKLARLYGDPRRAAAFAKMPVVIVAYSGGFGPTLSVLDHGGVGSRIRGIVMLDALYAGMDKFADWIANNRAAFFVSSYTTHTTPHNRDLEQLLSERSVAYGSQLRNGHLQGMVSFLPMGDVSHRDFVNRAWADYPIADILERMDDIETKAVATGTTKPGGSGAFAARN